MQIYYSHGLQQTGGCPTNSCPTLYFSRLISTNDSLWGRGAVFGSREMKEVLVWMLFFLLSFLFSLFGSVIIFSLVLSFSLLFMSTRQGGGNLSQSSSSGLMRFIYIFSPYFPKDSSHRSWRPTTATETTVPPEGIYWFYTTETFRLSLIISR